MSLKFVIISTFSIPSTVSIIYSSLPSSFRFSDGSNSLNSICGKLFFKSPIIFSGKLSFLISIFPKTRIFFIMNGFTLYHLASSKLLFLLFFLLQCSQLVEHNHLFLPSLVQYWHQFLFYLREPRLFYQWFLILCLLWDYT